MLALGFAAIGLGAILGIAGITGSSLHSIVQGKPDHSKNVGLNEGGTSSGATTVSAATTVSGNVSERQFAVNLLKQIGLSQSPQAVEKVLAWMKQEGGNWHNNAKYNPLNTTLEASGATAINSAGVKSYTSWTQGLEATARTLAGYPEIISALRSGTLSQFESVVTNSRWGTKF